MATTASASLLLLPLSKFPAQQKQLRAQYQPTIESALLQCKPTTADSTSRLDIAVIIEPTLENRTALFNAAQHLFADLYTLICSIASQQQIELDYPGGIDVRIFLTTLSNETEPTNGPVVSASSLITSRQHSYSKWLAPSTFESSDQGQRFQHFWKRHTSGSSGSLTTEALPTGPSDADSSNIQLHPNPNPTGQSIVHTRVAVGGTFDHLHLGHKLLLTATILVPQPQPDDPNQDRDREITVGITGDELLVNKKHATVLESWDQRQQRTADFVESILVFHGNLSSIRTITTVDEPGPNGKVVKVAYNDESTGTGRQVTINYTRISDPFGPTITDESISALIISAETRAGGKAVNDRREKLGWKPLEVFEVDVLDAGADVGPGDGDTEQQKKKKEERTSFEGKISSTEIRRRLAEARQSTT